MSSVIGTIKFVLGQVYVIAVDGSQRLLSSGDKIYSGEEVVTGNSGAVSIALPDGRTLDLGRDSNWSGTPGATPTNNNENQNQDIASLQAQIAAGQDPTKTLEATAAG
ncbi:MAG: hypothetical protein XXXJIFNMEKO3_03362 [Candidatus Erwinia impunctatus]